MFRNPFSRKTKLLSATAAPVVDPLQSDPLMDEVVQVCAFDVPAFTVVRQDAETAYVLDEVARHIDSLDEWTPDVFDYEGEKRHRIRVSEIHCQAIERHQEATRALADTDRVQTQVMLKVHELRRREQELQAQYQGWVAILAGVQTAFNPHPIGEPALPVPASAITAPMPPVVAEGPEQVPSLFVHRDPDEAVA